MSRLLAISALLVVVLAGPSGSGGAGARAADEDATDLQALVDGAEPGSELRLPAGTYRGGVVVDKPLRIVGEGWPVVDGQGDGNILEITAPDVTIEGLVLRGSGSSLDRENAGVSSDGSAGIRIVGNRFEDVLFGVFLRRAPDSLVADNVIGAKELSLGRRGDGIRLWESPGTTIEGNTVTDGRDSVLWFSEGLVVRDNVVKRGRYGLHFMYSDDALVEGNWLEGNSVGGFLMYSRNLTLRDNVAFDNRGPSGYGFGFKDMDGIEADGNRLVDNRVGLYFDNSPWSTDVYQHFRRNVVAYNDIGLEFNPSVKRNVFSANAFIDNREQVSLTGGGTFVDNNEWTADGVGNFWSDYAGYDSDGDGLGEVPYRAEDLFGELTDDHPEVAFFSNSPAARAVDMAAQAFPVLRPDPKLVDEAPMVSPPDVPPLARAPAEGSRGLLAVASLAMVGLAAAVVVASGAWPRRRLGLTGVGA